MTTVISTTGSDLTRSEFLEFYAKSSGAPGQALIIDIGSVSEDAFYFDAFNQTNGTYEDGTRWGLGVLDTEAKLAERELWSTEKDARGLWAQQCTGSGLNAPPLGDPSANCARGNGFMDSEDLDGNGILDDSEGAYHRYVVPLDELSAFVVRDTSQTKTNYKLYRIPLRDGIAVNGANAGTWRFVKHMRMTVASSTMSNDPVENFTIARMRIIGSRWVKRDIDGVVRGLTSDKKGTPGAEVRVSPVSRLTTNEYRSPANVDEKVQDPTQGFGVGTEFNEKGIAIKYNTLAAGDRAEVYFRYPQQPRSFMNYRTMRLWALPKQGNWGEGGDQKLVVRIGTDERNYYMFQTRLRGAISGVVAPGDWMPEITIDFEEWFDLKAKAELELLKTNRTSNEPFVLFSEDSTYAIVMEDRARAPNLASIRELTFAVYNGGIGSADGEVWLNDVRLTSALTDPGVAGNFALTVQGGDFLNASVTYANQGALFRQLNQDANYMAAGDFSVNTTAQLGNMLPASWGMEIPLTVAYASNRQDPMLLEQSDVRADQLEGLREIGASNTRIGMSLRKRTPSAHPLLAAVVDGMTLRLGYNAGDATSIAMRNEASGFDGALLYSRDVKRHELDFMPAFVEAALRFLAPALIENSEAFGKLVGMRLRYTPDRVAFSSSYSGQERRAYQYQRIIALPSDTVVLPIESPRKSLDTDAVISFTPFSSLNANFNARTTRDLLPAQRASTRSAERSALEQARSGLLGADLGWEANRSLTSTLNWRPPVSSWLRPNVQLSTRFATDRNPSYIEILTTGPDTTAVLQRRFQADRQLSRSIEFVPQNFVRSIIDDSTGFAAGLAKVVGAVQPVTVRLNTALGSQFERETRSPDLRYQFGLGDLESFRLMGIDSAIALTETARLEARTGIRLPKNAQLELSYTDVQNQAFDQRGGTRSDNDVIWPSVQLNWGDVPLPGFVRMIIPRMGGRISVERVRRHRTFGFAANQNRGENELRVPFSLNLTLPARLVASYTGTWTTGDREDPTGDVNTDAFTHQVNLSGTFKPPGSLAEKMNQPIRTSLSLSQNTSMNCRFKKLDATAEEQTCIPYIDFRNQTVNFTLDTFMSDMTVGLQMSYTGRQDYIGVRRGSSQFQLSLFGEFNLNVGQLPGMAAPAGMGSGGIR